MHFLPRLIVTAFWLAQAFLRLLHRSAAQVCGLESAQIQLNRRMSAIHRAECHRRMTQHSRDEMRRKPS